MRRYMNNSNTLTLKRKSDYALVVHLISEIIDELVHSSDILKHEISSCATLRRQRKELHKSLTLFLSEFNSLSETKKANIELNFYKLGKKFDRALPKAKSEIKENTHFLFSFFLNRELTILGKLVNDAQKSMAADLYKDKTQEILSNPELYKKMETAWGDWPVKD